MDRSGNQLDDVFRCRPWSSGQLISNSPGFRGCETVGSLPRWAVTDELLARAEPADLPERPSSLGASGLPGRSRPFVQVGSQEYVGGWKWI